MEFRINVENDSGSEHSGNPSGLTLSEKVELIKQLCECMNPQDKVKVLRFLFPDLTVPINMNR
jgi:hypothetical protein